MYSQYADAEDNVVYLALIKYQSVATRHSVFAAWLGTT